MNEPITVTFVEDEAFYLEAHREDPFRHRAWIISIGLIIAVFWVSGLQVYNDLNHNRKLWWITLFIPVVMSPVIFWGYSPVGQARMLRRKLKKVIGNQPGRLEFSAEGFRTVGSSGGLVFTPWPQIYQVVERKNGLLIFYSKQSYFWVPRRLFENQQVYDRVLAVIASNVNDFKPAKP